MGVMTELSRFWGTKNHEEVPIAEVEFGNPMPYFEQGCQVVYAAITQACLYRNCTYPELLEEVRKVDPGIVDRYFQLSAVVDCDVYGKWCSGTLTPQEFQIFCMTVDNWKDITFRLIETLDNGQK